MHTSIYSLIRKTLNGFMLLGIVFSLLGINSLSARAQEVTTLASTGTVVTTEPTETPTGIVTATEPTAMPTETVVTTEPTETPTGTVTATEPTAMPTETVATTEPTALPTGTVTATEPTAMPTEPPTEMVATAPMADTITLNSIPGPSGTFSSAFTIQNISASNADCYYQFFDATGVAIYTSGPFVIPVGGSNYTYVPSISGLTSGQYSGVVYCNQQVAAVVNSSTANSGGSYDAVAATGTTWYAPNAFSNYYNYNTNLVVQNATSSLVNVTVQIINASGTVVATQTANNVPAYASTSFDQTGLAGLSTNVAYSAKITGTGPLAVESNIYGQGSSVNQLFSYTPFSGGSTAAYAPVIMNNYYGYITALTVQNLGTNIANVTVTYGTGTVQNQQINPSAAYVFYTPNAGLPSGVLTSAIIASDQPIVALVNEQNNYDRAASYSAFASGSTKVSVPIVLRRYYNYNTSVTCQNVGSSSTNMTITYNNAATSSQNNIPHNGTALFYQPTDPGLSDGFNGSATITTSGQPIVCVVNEDENEGTLGTTFFDQLFAYEGIPVP